MQKDIVIIGGGSAGSVAALRSAQNDLDVALIERDKLGGCCLEVGCIPSKALLNISDLVYSSINSEELGIRASVDIDYEKTTRWKENLINKIRNMLQRSLKRAEIEIIRGEAHFSSSNKLVVSGKNEESIEFDKAVVASGSRPVELPGFSFEKESILNSRQFLNLPQLPESLLIVGAGYIGMELGTVCAKLGVDVTIIEMEEQILPGWDKKLVKPLFKKCKELGIDVHFNLKASEAENRDKKVLVTAESKSGKAQEFSAEKCLVTIGREPQTESLRLENTDVTVDKAGFIETDETKQTKDSNIYAAGDVSGEPMLAHKAFRDACIAVDSILEKEAPPIGKVPAVVFTDPQIARVGLSPSGQEKANVKTGKAYFRAIEAAYTKNKTEGFARIAIDEETGVILGGEIVGSDASELIHGLEIAVQQELTVKDIVQAIHTHPTLSEIIARAAERGGDFSTYSI